MCRSVDSRGDLAYCGLRELYVVTLSPGRANGNLSRSGQILCSLYSETATIRKPVVMSPCGLSAWIRLTVKAHWRVVRVNLWLNMASVAVLGSVTWHTSNVSVIDHAMSGGPNNLIFGLLTLV